MINAKQVLKPPLTKIICQSTRVDHEPELKLKYK